MPRLNRFLSSILRWRLYRRYVAARRSLYCSDWACYFEETLVRLRRDAVRMRQLEWTLFLWARLSYARKKWTQSEALFVRLLRTLGEHPGSQMVPLQASAFYNLGLLTWKKDNPEKAINFLQQVIDLRSKAASSDLVYLTAIAELATGEILLRDGIAPADECLRLFDRAENELNSLRRTMEVKNSLVDAKCWKVAALRVLDKDDEALVELASVKEIGCNCFDNRLGAELVYALLSQAEIFLKQGKRTHAIQKYSEAVAMIEWLREHEHLMRKAVREHPKKHEDIGLFLREEEQDARHYLAALGQ